MLTSPSPRSLGPRIVLALILGFAPAAALLAQTSAQTRLAEQFALGKTFMGIRVLDAKHLAFVRVDGFAMVELSGLAWDQDEQILYALSDHGHVFHVRLDFDEDTINQVEFLAAYALRDPQGAPLGGRSADAEGVALRNHRNGRPGDTELIVSFEGEPRVQSFSPTGIWQDTYPLPQALSDPDSYRSRNKALEGLTVHPRFGVLVAPEWPLHSARNQSLQVTALTGEMWVFPRYEAPKSGLVAMEALEDGSLLTLERSFVSVFQPLIVALRRTQPLGVPVSQAPLPMSDVAVFNSFKGFRPDNFEGLTHLEGKRFLMVSDDNQSALQQTILLYFELLDQ